MTAKLRGSGSSSAGKAGVGRMVGLAVVTLLAILSLFPLYWMASGSFKLQGTIAQVPPALVPWPPSFENWSRVLIGTPTASPLLWVWNSLLVSLGTVVVSVAISATCGFAFAKLRFIGRRVLFFLVLATMFLPVQVTIIPLFLVVHSLGLYNTHLGMILPLAVYPFGIFLMRQFIIRIPSELLEAAGIDGASAWQQFRLVVLPLARPALAALAIFTFFAAWNNFMWQLVMAKDQAMMTLPVGISVLATGALGSDRGVPDYGILMAGGTLGAIPMVIFFAVFQRHFVRGIAAGALKG